MDPVEQVVSDGDRLSLFGPPRLESAAGPVRVDTRKAVALLAYLAVSGRSSSRDELAGLLWPEYSQSRARAALRRTLSALGRTPARGWLEVSRESVGLAAGVVRVDVAEFRRALELAEGSSAEADSLPFLERAADLYGGDFMAGFGLRDSVAFDDWQFFEAESLRRELSGALERLVRGNEAGRRWAAAVSHARRWLSLDPLNEAAHRALMRLYYHSGERAAALRQYRECERHLQRELGLEPLEETTRLYQDLRDNRLPQPVQHTRRTRPTVDPAVDTGETRLSGRAAELEELLGAYESAGAGGGLCIVEGEAGIGKTRLAEELLRHARERGATILEARCHAGEGALEYTPVSEALAAALAEPASATALDELPEFALAEASRLLPELRERLSAADEVPTAETGSRSRFFEALFRVVDGLLSGGSGRDARANAGANAEATAKNGVLFVDDLHLADAATAALVSYLCRRLSARPVFLLMTLRPEPAATGLRDELLAARRETARHVPLRRLGPAAVEEMSGSRLTAGRLPEGYPLQKFARRLHEETEGLPLFVEEYLAAVERGLPVTDGEWTLPEGVRTLLRRRLAGSAGELPDGRQLLNAAAVAGPAPDFDTLVAVSGYEEAAAVEALEGLVARGLLKESPGAAGEPAYAFYHDKLRSLVYEEMSLARRRLLHRRAAEALAGKLADTLAEPLANAGPAPFGRAARHYRLAGKRATAARYLRRAGEQARALHANREAVGHFEEALELGYPDPAALHEALGDLRTTLGEYAAAVESYTRAGPRPEIEHRLGNVRRMQGEWDRAEEHFRRALEGGLPVAERARLQADRSLMAHRRGRPAEARELAEEALRLSAGDPRALLRAHNALGVLAGRRGEYPAAREHLQQSLTLARELADTGGRVAAMNNLAQASAAEGRYEEAARVLEEALALCARLGDRHREAALHSNLADALYRRGEAAAAMRHQMLSVEIFAQIEAGEVPRPEIWKLTEW